MKTQEFLVNASTVVVAASALAIAITVVRRDLGPEGSRTAQGPTHQSRQVADWQDFERGGHHIGASEATAPLKIVEFGDYECPVCGAFARSLRSIMSRHANDVSLVFRHWPLSYHRFAYASARAAECASGQGRFTAFHDLLYSKQDSLGLLTFHDFALRAGVPNLAQFDACNSNPGSVVVIDSDVAAVKRLQGWGTPTLIVNGTLLSSIPDSATLERMIADAKRK